MSTQKHTYIGGTTMANTDEKSINETTPKHHSRDVPADTSLERAIEAERARLLQVSSILHCLYEVLLYAEGDEAVTYAEVAHVAAILIDESVERLDSVRLR